MLTSLMSVSAFATTVPAFTLSQSYTQLVYLIPQGTTFNGTIVTTGAVRFFVSSPTEAEIVNLGIVDKTTTFNFVAQQSGNYTLNFENDMPNPVQVSFSYVTNPAIPSGNNPSGTGISLTYLLTIILIAVLGILIILLILHLKKPAVGSNQS